jgi:hypothetical protein
MPTNESRIECGSVRMATSALREAPEEDDARAAPTWTVFLRSERAP